MLKKCLLVTSLNKTLQEDPTKTIETKVQQTLLQIKHVFNEEEYKKL